MNQGNIKGSVALFQTRQLPSPQRARTQPSAQSPLNVLVIDDTPEDRMAVRVALAAGGFILQEASNAAHGLELARASTSDCILIDLGLPDMQGLALLKALRRKDGQLPCAVVMFSSAGKAEIAAAALKAGALDTIVKDHLDPDLLRRSIRSTVRQFALMEAQRLAERRNAHLAAIVASSSDAIISIGTDTVVQSWNPGAQLMFGWSEAEALGRAVSELIVPEAKEPERGAIYEAVMSGKVAVLKETERRHKDGSLIPVEVAASPILDTFGRVAAISVIFRDISERRRTKAALSESEERFHTAFRSAPLAMIIRNQRDGRCIDVNEAALALTGYSHDEMVGHGPEGLGIYADPGLFARLQTTAVAENLETVFCRKDGSTRTVLLSSAPIALAGEPHMLLTAADITARKHAERALRESEERFRTIFTTAQEGIWAVDRSGRTILANPRLAELLGTTVDAMSAKYVADFFFEADAEEGRERFEANLAGQTEEFEFRFRRADGSAITMLAVTAPLRGPGGKIIGTLGGFVDLSERKKAEERQRMLMRELAHRGKNLLAMVQSIARRSLVDDRPMAEARAAFVGRLQALSRTYSSLTDEVFEGAFLDEIVASELRSFGGRARAAGPKIMLGAKVAQTFALIVHELAANAAKYGALSTPAGQLDVTWRTPPGDVGRRFAFEWVERGGPPATAPARHGFGSTIISVVAGGEVKCTPEIAYDETGFRYRIDAQLAGIGTVIDESPVRDRLKTETMRSFYDAWARLRGPDDALPLFKSFDRERFAVTGGLTIAQITHDGDVRMVEVGKALSERLGRIVADCDLASEDAGSMQEAYRRCARANAPCYETLRFDFGDGNVTAFERLLVPLSRGGKRATHIAGIVVFSGETAGGPAPVAEAGPEHYAAPAGEPSEAGLEAAGAAIQTH